MKTINSVYSRKTVRPEKILQFGEGNFLRAFADYLVDVMNEKGLFDGSVVLCQPIEKGLTEVINDQDGIYTLILRGRENGKAVEKTRIIESVSRCISPYENFEALLEVAKSPDLKIVISNTTEAGIQFVESDKLEDAPPSSYPAKLTRVLYERFVAFNGSDESALYILPVELIENNGTELKKCVLAYADLWNLPEEFTDWVEKCGFSNTLVDRIVTGYPRNEIDSITEKLGYIDNLIDTAEPFFFWAIEDKEGLKDVFPADKAGLGAVFCPDISGYKMRKVRILNGAHTVSVLGAYLSGFDIVRDMMNDETVNNFINTVLQEEIIPFIPLPQKEKEDFAFAVLERFNNPFIDHRLLDISLNSVSKFKARCLPSLLDNVKAGRFPKRLFFGLSCLIEFYNGKYDENGLFLGKRGDGTYEIKDNKDVLDFFSNVNGARNKIDLILSNVDFWGQDLTEIDGAVTFVENCCEYIDTLGVKKAMENI
ncbi:MAG: tagaturonate reductase [Oscillospiraceae bacterium]|nr:tagaturonate reductase [Oscillospiraceae bacterium]